MLKGWFTLVQKCKLLPRFDRDFYMFYNRNVNFCLRKKTKVNHSKELIFYAQTTTHRSSLSSQTQRSEQNYPGNQFISGSLPNQNVYWARLRQFQVRYYKTILFILHFYSHMAHFYQNFSPPFY